MTTMQTSEPEAPIADATRMFFSKSETAIYALLAIHIFYYLYTIGG